jgi:hypothetical protein
MFGLDLTSLGLVQITVIFARFISKASIKKGRTFISGINFFKEDGSDPEAAARFRVNHEMKFSYIKTRGFVKLNYIKSEFFWF